MIVQIFIAGIESYFAKRPRTWYGSAI